MKQSRSQRGFTLIELMVSISILVMLSTWGMVTYRTQQQKQSLRRIGTEIVSLLRDAEARSVAGVDQSVWSVRFFADRYELQKAGLTYQTYDLNGLVFAAVNVFADGSGGNTDFVEFLRPSGRTDHTGTIELFRPEAPAHRYVVTVSALGRISGQEVSI